MSNASYATREDLAKLETALIGKISSIEGEIKVVKWLLGTIAVALISAAARYIVG